MSSAEMSAPMNTSGDTMSLDLTSSTCKDVEFWSVLRNFLHLFYEGKLVEKFSTKDVEFWSVLRYFLHLFYEGKLDEKFSTNVSRR
jgi:hypothetical protein